MASESSPDDKYRKSQQLIDYSRRGNIEGIEDLLAQNVSVDSRGDLERTPLMVAVQHGKSDVVKFLLEAGANPNLQDNWGNSALMFLPNKGIKIAEELFKYKANPNLKNDNEETPLMKIEYDRDIAQLLIKNGAIIDVQNKSGNTALMLRVRTIPYFMVKTLLESGANPNIKNKYGKTAYEMADDRIYVKNLIRKYQDILENIMKLEYLQKEPTTYFSQIPKDLVFLIKDYLRNDV